MGNLLSHPIEEKVLETISHEHLTYSIGSMQGYRMTMEDEYNIKVNEDESLSIFGVFDGHGGKEIAEIVSDKLIDVLFKELNELVKDETTTLKEYMTCVKDVFFGVDNELPHQPSLNCGTTAIVNIIIHKKYIISANTGDSRSIMSLDGGNCKTLSFDHKPSNMGERVRIENSGGYVINGRVNEILALSRAFGDFKFKIPFIELKANNNTFLEKNKRFFKNDLIHLPPELFQVSSEPDLLIYDLQQLKQPEFIILACDGIWDCYRNDDLIRLIRDKLVLDWSLQNIIEFILNDCISMASNITGIGFDNMTIIIIAVHDNSNIDDWYDMMKTKILKEKNLE
ncbi:protein phosphatase 2C homolog 4 [[Candida] jaroonii]|uniref:Protein phosphatase 2C homolog 4 n=1 Tax=[Candida] jaroonii TaxID=467808 RepID=A0ACA9Y2J4_9ASCO|nr:protein phosphatase 2C homolog 4 [[Candida] jaroonii]